MRQLARSAAQPGTATPGMPTQEILIRGALLTTAGAARKDEL